jgi:hypothetical protein
VLLLVHAAYFLMAFIFKRIYMGDSFEYIYEALNIKYSFFFYRGNPTLPIMPEYMTQRQPGYPFFLLLIYLFTVNNWLVIFFQNLLSVFNIYYCRSVFIKLGYDIRYDWLLLILLKAYPSQFINANTIDPDILLQTFTLLYFGCFVLLYQTRQVKYSLFMSLALIGGLMVKPVLYPFVIIHLLIVIAFHYKHFRRQVVVAAVLPLAVVLLYNWFNYTRTGKFHFSSNQAFNAIFYYYGFIARNHGADSAQNFLQDERKDIAARPLYKDRYDYANRRGVELLRQNFGPYIKYHLKHSARIFIEPGKAEMNLFTGSLTYGKLYSREQAGFFATLDREGWKGIVKYMRSNPSMVFVICVLFFNLVRLVGLFIFFFLSTVHLHIRLFIFMLLSYFALIAGPISNTRYFLPVSLIAIGCAVAGYAGVLEKRKHANN